MSGGIDYRLTVAAELLQSAAEEIQREQHTAKLSLVDIVRDEHRANIVRSELMPKALQSQVAWAIMSELYSAYAEGRRSCVKHVCLASTAPNTTVLRHLSILVRDGWVRRSAAESDKRVVWLIATEPAIELIESWAGRRADDLVQLQSASL